MDDLQDILEMLQELTEQDEPGAAIPVECTVKMLVPKERYSEIEAALRTAYGLNLFVGEESCWEKRYLKTWLWNVDLESTLEKLRKMSQELKINIRLKSTTIRPVNFMDDVEVTYTDGTTTLIPSFPHYESNRYDIVDGEVRLVPPDEELGY